LQLYFGLLVFLGYMVFDTQEIIERAHHGDMDYIKHALTLFTDFVAVLVRVLVIMVSCCFCCMPVTYRTMMAAAHLRLPALVLISQLKNAQEKSQEDKKRKKRY